MTASVLQSCPQVHVRNTLGRDIGRVDVCVWVWVGVGVGVGGGGWVGG